MSTASSSNLMKRIYELRERTKDRWTAEVHRTVDELFEIILNEMKLPSNSGLTSSASRGDVNQISSINKLKATSKASLLATLPAPGLPDSSGLLFNSDSLRQIFNANYHPVSGAGARPPTSDSEPSPHGSDCECDSCAAAVPECDQEESDGGGGAGCSDFDDHFGSGAGLFGNYSDLPGLLEEINQEVFSREDSKTPLLDLTSFIQGSSTTSSSLALSSPSESQHFIVPPNGHHLPSPIGPNTPPSKISSNATGAAAATSAWGRNPASFAKIVASSSSTAASPTSTSNKKAKSKSPTRSNCGKGNGSKESSGSSSQVTQRTGVDGGPFHDYSHQFKTRYVKCYIGSCKQTFNMMPTLNKHLKDVHNVRKHRCPLPGCGASYLEVQEYTTHVFAKHSDVTEWLCDRCPEKFEHHRALGQHHYFTHQEGWFECKVKDCVVGAKNRGAIIHHCKIIHHQGSTDPEFYYHLLTNPPDNSSSGKSKSTTPPSTDSAASSTSGGSASARLPKDHQYDTKAVYCVIRDCPTRMTTVDELNGHLKEVHKKSAIFCPILNVKCTETFDKMCQMDLHVLRDHSNLTKWQCGLCAFIGRDHRQLSAHIYWCHCEGEFKCVQCNFIGRYRNDVTTHFAATH